MLDSQVNVPVQIQVWVQVTHIRMQNYEQGCTSMHKYAQVSKSVQNYVHIMHYLAYPAVYPADGPHRD